MTYLTPDQANASSGEDITDILGLGQNASQQDKLALQQKLAVALRNQQPAQGQAIPSGSVFIPPSPLTTAMQTFDHLQGIVASAQGKKDSDQLDKDRSKGLAHFAKMWFNKQNGQPGATDPNQGPPTALMNSPQNQVDSSGYGDDDSNE